MKIPTAIVSIVLTALLLLEAWTLSTVFALATDVAAIKAQLSKQTQLAKTNEQ